MLNKITYTTDTVKKRLKVTFNPKLEDCKLEDKEYHLNSILSGTHIALAIMLQDVSIMRAATLKERENNIYVYVEPEHDNKMFHIRKNLRDVIKDSFEKTLEAIFPDVHYIEGTQLHNQELMMDLSPEEAAEYVERIREVTECVKENPIDIPKEEKDVLPE